MSAIRSSSSILPTGRQRLIRLCDACAQQRRTYHPTTSSWPWPVIADSSRPPLGSRSRHSASMEAQTRRCPSARFFATSSSRASPATSSPHVSSSQNSAEQQPRSNTHHPQRERIQPTSTPQTHYDFFSQTLPLGPPPAGPFEINVRALRREFLQLQAKAHPDMAPAHLKARAEGLSARINDAYKTLSSPLLRAQYLLSLAGEDVANDETAKVEDPDLLMEVLEAREEIEDAREESELEGLKWRNEKRIDGSVKILGGAFEKGDLDAAKTECTRLRYWVNIREGIQNWAPGKPVVLEH